MRVARECVSVTGEHGLDDYFIIEDYDGLGGSVTIAPEKYDTTLDGFADITYQIRDGRREAHFTMHVGYESTYHNPNKIKVADICEFILSNEDNIRNIIEACPGAYIPIKFYTDPMQYGFNTGYMKKEEY